MDRFLQSKGQSSQNIHDTAYGILVKHASAESKILDLGCGTGGFSQLLRGNGFKSVFSCDAEIYEQSLVGPNFKKINLNGNFEYESNQFDAVISLEVIEHIENPRAFLREITRICKPGGTVILSTPNNENWTSLLSLLFRGYYSAFADSCYPAHITPILEIDAKRILIESGLKDLEVIWTNKGRMPSLNLHWQDLLSDFAKGKRFSDNFFFVAKK